jgi:exodeoxyribonuclease V gamma subunit
MSDAAHAGSTQSHWRAGDRSRREDDRYLFLEALLSARDKLYISWQGRRTTDHEIKPPSVLVAQLMDYLNAVWTHDGGLACEAPLQPLQAFSPKYFTQDSTFQTYADDWQTAQSSTHTAPPKTTDTTQNQAPTDLALKQLNRLLKQPVDVFVRDRLRLHLDSPQEASAQEEPFALDHLDSYTLTQSIVQAPDPEHALQVLRLSGELALAGFGQAQQDMLLQQRDELLERFEVIAKDWPLDLPVQSARFTLGEHTLSAEWANGQQIWKTKPDQSAWLQVEMRPGSVLEGKEKAKHPRAQTLTTLWLNHLVACASGKPTTSVQIGLNGAVQLDALSQSDALAELQNLVKLYQEAWHKPLPVARKTACAFAMTMQTSHEEDQAKSEAALQAAQQVFDGNRNLTGEYESSTTLQRVFNDFVDLQLALPDMAERVYGTMVKSARLLSTAKATETHGEADA